jgi:hypothetical protein
MPAQLAPTPTDPPRTAQDVNVYVAHQHNTQRHINHPSLGKEKAQARKGEGTKNVKRREKVKKRNRNINTYCSRATIFIPSSNTPVIFPLMYCRTGAPCGVASVGSGAVEEGMVVVEPVFVVAAWSGWREAARDVVEGGCCG